MKKGYLFFLCLFFSSILTAQKKKQTLADTINQFDNYIQNAMQTWQVPGMTVAIVKSNEIIFSKGYGVREIGTNHKVNSKTYFSCASTTKAMTALCMGILVDDAKVQWSDQVIKYVPDFQLQDPFVTKELTVRDLFIHNTGIGNTDYLWGDNTLAPDEILYKMRLVKPAYSFRSSFIYQNVFYLLAGKLIQNVAGKPWHVFIKEKIFDPLGMKNTKALYKEVESENRSYPHFIVDKKVTLIEKVLADAIGPAGSVSSSSDDMAIWMKCMIDSSKYNGGRLVKPQTWNYLFKPKTLVTESQFYPTQYITKPNFTTYAMGWFQQDYKGYKLNFHTGSLAGEIAIHAQVPDLKFGIYVFGNLDHAELRHALVFKAIDLFVLGGTTDWSITVKNLYDSLKKESGQLDSISLPKQIPNTKPAFLLNNYAGIYEDELYGSIKIIVENDQLMVVINKVLKGELSHYHFNTFKVNYQPKYYPADYYTFQVGSDGKINGLSISGIVYKRK